MRKQLSTAVLKRFMSESEFAKFVSQYKSHLQEKRAVREATEKDFEILKGYRSGLHIKELAKKYGTSASAIRGAIVAAAR